MARAARVASAAGPEEEKKSELAAAADVLALDVVTGLEDPAISPNALAAAEASRRAYDARQDDGRRSTIFIDQDGRFTLGDWLAIPRVKRELRKIERALSNVENGTGSIEDVNMHYAVVAVNFDQIDRFVRAGGRCRREMIQPTRTAQHQGRGCGTHNHTRGPHARARAHSALVAPRYASRIQALARPALPRAQVIYAPTTQTLCGHTPRTPSLRPLCSTRRSRSGN